MQTTFIDRTKQAIKRWFANLRWRSDKKEKPPVNDLIGSWGMRTIPLYDEHAEQSSKEEREKTMTFIVAGISNKKPFLVVDCVGIDKSNNNRRFQYTKKLVKLISTNEETYFCLAGADSYGYAINLFDRECYEKGRPFDFKNEQHISAVLEMFRQIKEYRITLGFQVDNHARLYFVDKTDVFYYDIDEGGKLSKLQNIGINNYYINPYKTKNPPIKLEQQFENNQQLISFCKNEINKTQNYNIVLKDKFSYVIFDGERTVFDNSAKNNKELVYALTGADYDKIENPTANNA